MAEVSGITELQLLEKETSILKKQLDEVQKADNTSTACARIIANIEGAEEKDGFLVKEGAAVEQNQFHTAAGPAAGEGGCCVLS